MRKLFVVGAATCSLFVVVQALPAQIQGGWVNTGSMNANRELAVQVTLGNGKALVAGGTDGTSVLSRRRKSTSPLQACGPPPAQ